MLGTIKAMIHKVGKIHQYKVLESKHVNIVLGVEQKQYHEYFIIKKPRKEHLLGFLTYQCQQYVFKYDIYVKEITMVNKSRFASIPGTFYTGTVLLIHDNTGIADCKMIHGKICIKEHILIRQYMCKHIHSLCSQLVMVTILPIQDLDTQENMSEFRIIPSFENNHLRFKTTRTSECFMKLLSYFEKTNNNEYAYY